MTAEYFVTYCATVYPSCQTGGHGDKPIIKPCFTSIGCKQADQNKTYEKNVCNRKRMKGECERFKEPCCGRLPYACISKQCPESKQVAACRVSVGILDDEGKEFFESQTAIRDKVGFTLESLDLSSLKSRHDHRLLLERFDTLEQYDKNKSLELYAIRFGSVPDYYEFLKKCKRIANIIAEFRKPQIAEQSADMERSQTDVGVAQSVETKTQKKKIAKRKTRPSLDEVAKTLEIPSNEQENENWILAQNINAIKATSLRTRRSEGETIELSGESLLNRDKQGRISWKPEEDSQKVFYFRPSLRETDMQPPKKKNEKK